MKVVVDASVALKWFFSARAEEDDVDAALRILRGIHDGSLSMLQPPHFVAEVSAVLAREFGKAATSRLGLLLDIEMETASNARLYARAVELSSRLSHHLFDTLYHAVALESAGAVLVTADERYARAARHEGRVIRLARFAGAT